MGEGIMDGKVHNLQSRCHRESWVTLDVIDAISYCSRRDMTAGCDRTRLGRPHLQSPTNQQINRKEWPELAKTMKGVGWGPKPTPPLPHFS